MNVDLGRVQFALTSIYHFLFVPVTMGLSFLVAVMQTLWYRTRADAWRGLTRFFGTLLLINVVVGVVTGLVQEFEFGMNWSAYSRYVGDVFGGPLAMEGLAAFFLESTFLGLWLFGWERLPKRVHLFCIWMVALGSSLSAAFIMAANSWMQHPVGYAAGNPPRLDDIGAVFTNPMFLWGYLHVLLAALATGALVMLAVSAWQLRRGREAATFTRSAALAVSVLVPVSIPLVLVGSQLGVIETTYQPMKIAAAEAEWNTCQPCSFSAFQIRGGNRDETPTKVIAIPHLLSILATLSWNGQVQGLNELQTQYEQRYGPGDYVPNVFIQYWSMRLMAYLGTAVVLLALWGAWLMYRRRLARAKWVHRVAVWAVAAPFVMNTAGWMLTENGRQPWIVQGLMKTADGVSPSVSVTEIWISLGVFALLFVALGVTDLVLMLRYARRELPAEVPEPRAAVPALTY